MEGTRSVPLIQVCRKKRIDVLKELYIHYITKLFDMNVAPTKIQMAAGHTDIRTTNGYCHAEKCDEIDEEILEKAL